MMKSKLHLHGLIMTVIIILIAVPIGNVEAQEQWHQDIARQLVAEGWEQVISQDSTAVIYGVQLVELDDVWSCYIDVSFAGGFSNATDQKIEWSISADPDLLGFVLSNNLVAASVTLAKGPEGNHHVLDSTSWVGTVGQKPVNFSITHSNPRSSDGVNSKLALMLQPQKFIMQTNQIETLIRLDYQSSSGSIVQLDTTVFAGSVEALPIAVISIKQKENESDHKKYFVLFLRGGIVASKDYPSEMPLIRVSNVNGLEGLFEQLLPAQEPSVVKKHALNTDLIMSTDGVGFAIKYTWMLQEELGIRAHLLDRPGDIKPVMYLGLVDQIQWSECFSGNASFLPLGWDTNVGSLITDINGGFGLSYTYLPWEFSYNIDYLDAKWQHTGTLRYVADESISCKFGLTRRDGSYSYNVGLSIEM